MHMLKRVRVLWTLGMAAVGLTILAGAASASVTDVSTERSGSIIVFPKVIWDGTRDTIIEISNTSNSLIHARCFYVNSASGWNETDFSIWLTRQQPTHWVASLGRSSFPCSSPGDDSCGLSPGLVPPVPFGFQGELKCVQVDDSDAPYRGNALKGEATLRYRSGDVSDYNAVAFQGNPDMSVQEGIPDDLVLDYTATHAGEYSACPDTLLFNHFAEGASDLVIDQLGNCVSVCITGSNIGLECSKNSDCGTGATCGACPVSTELTLVPCQEDLENQIPGKVTVQFIIHNEFEQPFSASTTVDCWLNAPLGRIASTLTSVGTNGSLFMYTRINPNPNSGTNPNSGGVIGVAEEIRSDTYFELGLGAPAAAAFNLQVEGNRFDAATNGNGVAVPGTTDHMILPEP